MPKFKIEIDLEELLDQVWQHSTTSQEGEILSTLVEFIDGKRAVRGHSAVAFKNDGEVREYAKYELGMIDKE